jgi:hypothetical protein
LAKLTRAQSGRLRRACHDYFQLVEGQQEAGDPEFPLESMAADLTALAIGLIADARIEPLPKPGYLRRLEIFRRADPELLARSEPPNSAAETIGGNDSLACAIPRSPLRFGWWSAAQNPANSRQFRGGHAE